MSKRTLGRGLGDLLGTSRGTEPVSPPKPTVNAGLRILIAGTQQAPEGAATAAATPATLTETTPGTAIPPNGTHLGPLTRMLTVGALASADLALLGWAAHYALTHKQILSFGGAAGCTCTVLVAALCGTTAISLIAVPNKK